MSREPKDRGLKRGGSEADVHGQETIQSDDVDLLGDGTVEIVMVRHGEAVRETKRRPFEEWAATRCVRAARDAVDDYLEGRFEEPADVSVGWGRPTPDSDDLAVLVSLVTSLDREGRTIREPTLQLDELVLMTPRTAAATITLDDRHHSCTVPVYVRHRIFKLD